MPDGSLYSPDHDLSLKVEGLEKPRRKRGRPSKPPPAEVPPENKLDEMPVEEEEEIEEDINGRKRRRRKVPTRFLEALQVCEIFF